MNRHRHPLWLAYPRLLLLEVVAALLWLVACAAFIAADLQLWGEPAWHLRLLVEANLLSKAAAAAFLLLPASFLVALRSYRTAALSAALALIGSVFAIWQCSAAASAADIASLLGPACWLASALSATIVWGGAAFLDHTDKSFHRSATLANGEP